MHRYSESFLQFLKERNPKNSRIDPKVSKDSLTETTTKSTTENNVQDPHDILTESLINNARDKYPTLNVTFETNEFIQYWLSPDRNKPPRTRASWLDKWHTRLEQQAQFYSGRKAGGAGEPAKAGVGTKPFKTPDRQPKQLNAKGGQEDEYIAGV